LLLHSGIKLTIGVPLRMIREGHFKDLIDLYNADAGFFNLSS